jgi:hypothetical protein
MKKAVSKHQFQWLRNAIQVFVHCSKFFFYNDLTDKHFLSEHPTQRSWRSTFSSLLSFPFNKRFFTSLYVLTISPFFPCCQVSIIFRHFFLSLFLACFFHKASVVTCEVQFTYVCSIPPDPVSNPFLSIYLSTLAAFVNFSSLCTLFCYIRITFLHYIIINYFISISTLSLINCDL